MNNLIKLQMIANSAVSCMCSSQKMAIHLENFILKQYALTPRVIEEP